MQHSPVEEMCVLELAVSASTDKTCNVCFHKDLLQQDDILHTLFLHLCHLAALHNLMGLQYSLPGMTSRTELAICGIATGIF